MRFLYSEFYLKEHGGETPPDVHPRFTDMIGYLASVAPEGRLPGRQHVDPCALRDVLALVNIVDVERDGQEMRFRFRLVGGRQTEAAGRSITGLTVEEAVVPEVAPRIVANMRQVVEARLPLYDRFPMPHPDRHFIDSQRMYYPLASDGETVDKILILNGYDSAALRATA